MASKKSIKKDIRKRLEIIENSKIWKEQFEKEILKNILKKF